MKCLAFLLLLLNPVELVADDRCDVLEINHYFDDQGRLVFTQLIAFDWSPCHERHMVRAWRLVKDKHQIPERDWSSGDYVAVWLDGEVVRRLRAGSYRESWTQYDPELLEREILCKESRRGLRETRVLRGQCQ